MVKKMSANASSTDNDNINIDRSIPFQSRLCCTSCRSDLEAEEDSLVCVNCSTRYPVKNNIPLFSFDYIQSKGVESSKEKKDRSLTARKLPLLKKIYMLLTPPSFMFLQRGEDRLEHFLKEQYSNIENPFIVDIGAGAKRWQNVMSVDIYNYNGVDYCAYAERLPFKDNSVDMLISLSAIEHFKSMRNVYEEFMRVIKPGGIIFISAPFIYPFHAEPSDYHRWSANGLRDDFNCIEEIESGGYVGPHSAMHAVLSSYFSWMLSFGNHSLYMIINLFFGWLLFPLQIADRLRGQYRKPTPVDAIVYFVGKKKNI